MIESLLLAVTRVSTMLGAKQLTNATGFFFEREGRLYLVTNRHVVHDEAGKHFPDRIEIELHVDAENIGRTVQFSIPLYRDGKSLWLEGLDSAEVCELLDLTEGNQRVLLHRARAKVRQALEAHMDVGTGPA